jgi:lysophospholipase L1-like esterase
MGAEGDSTRRIGRLAAGSAILATAVGIGTTALAPASAEAAVAHKPLVVGLGDSVMAGKHCNCPDFLAQYAGRIGGTSKNWASSGTESSYVLKLLRRKSVQQSVTDAAAVLIMTGANDYGSAFDAVSHGASRSRYDAVASKVRRNVTAAVRKIHALNPHADIRILGYWAAEKAGNVAEQDYTSAQRSAARYATRSVDNALWEVAHAVAYARYVSTYKMFQDSPHSFTALLAADGDHLGQLGTAVVADALKLLFPNG